MDRIVALCHVDAREIAPDATDHIEPLALKFFQDVEALECLVDDALSFRQRASGHVHHAQRADGQGHAFAEPLPAADTDEFEARAAEIADHTFCIGNAGKHALCRQTRLLSTRDKRDFEAANFFGPQQKLRPILRIAHRRGRCHNELADADLVAQRDEAFQGCQRALDALGIETSGAGQ